MLLKFIRNYFLKVTLIIFAISSNVFSSEEEHPNSPNSSKISTSSIKTQTDYYESEEEFQENLDASANFVQNCLSTGTFEIPNERSLLFYMPEALKKITSEFSESEKIEYYAKVCNFMNEYVGDYKKEEALSYEKKDALKVLLSIEKHFDEIQEKMSPFLKRKLVFIPKKQSSSLCEIY